MKKWDELPVEIQEKMLERQFEQKGRKDSSVFKIDPSADKRRGGINFHETEEGHDFWANVIFYNHFDIFFQRYPKQQVTA